MTRTVMIQVRVSPREARLWRAVATQAGSTLSSFIRSAVRGWVAIWLAEREVMTKTRKTRRRVQPCIETRTRAVTPGTDPGCLSQTSWQSRCTGRAKRSDGVAEVEEGRR